MSILLTSERGRGIDFYFWLYEPGATLRSWQISDISIKSLKVQKVGVAF
jgi:hypothetical protein